MDMPPISDNNLISPQNSTMGVVLSGGAGSRFGGLDKGLQLYNGKHLIQAVLESLQPQVHDVMMCINRNEDQYRRFELISVYDEGSDYEGPLAGIVSAIKYIEENDKLSHIDSMLLSSCDSPALPNNHVAKLADSLSNGGCLSAVVHDGERVQNLHTLIHRQIWPSILSFYSIGGRAMHRWHKEVGSAKVDFSTQADCFLNINSLEDLI